MRKTIVGLMIGVLFAALLATPALADNTNCPGSYSCAETDIPGSGNYASGTGLPSQVDTGQGTYCTNEYYSNTGTVVLTGSATISGTSTPLEIRWRVWFATTPDPNATATKLLHTEGTSINTVVVSLQPDGQSLPGWFYACMVNYETGSPRADWQASVTQAD